MSQQWRKRIVVSGLAALAMVVLSGCAQDWKRAGLTEGITEQSQTVQNLWVGFWIVAMAVGVGVWGLIFWACFAYRRKRDDAPLPPQVRYNVPIEALYSVLPFIIIAVLFSYIARDQSDLRELSPHPDKVITVVGKRWSWDFTYTTDGVYETGTPDPMPVLYLPKGERVRFVLESRDVIHAFWVPAFLDKMDMIPGRVNEFEVTPQKLGTFSGKCAELCGQDHSRMLFEVRVVQPQQYQEHMQQLRDAGQVGSMPAGQLGPSLVHSTDTAHESGH